MSAVSALVYLWVRSAINRVRVRLRRLRQPKYLVGGLAGGLYLWMFLVRPMRHGRLGEGTAAGPAGLPGEWAVAIETGGAWVLLAVLAGFWLVPSRRAALDFSPAEMQFLFPAPISRRGLLHYKLAGWQVGLLFTSLMASLFSGRLLRGEGVWMAVLGWWLLLLLLQLHSLGASFVRTALLDVGVGPWKRRMAIAGLLGGTLLAALAWGWRSASAPPADWGDVEAVAAWWLELSRTSPVREILTPLVWVVRLPLARDPAVFLQALAWVGLGVGMHYVWILRATVAFEEASIEAAQAALQPGASARRRPPTSRARLLFPLAPEGPPWMAVAWRNLAAAGPWVRGRALPWVAGGGVVGLLLGMGWLRETGFGAVLGLVAGVLWVLSVLVGPSAGRMDFRQDLSGHGWEALRALPLSGWRVVLGQLLAPWGVLVAGQGVLALAVVGCCPVPPGLGDIGPRERVIAWGAMVMLGTSATLLGLCLHNATALLFPAWTVPPGSGGRGGVEVMGQRMIVQIAQILVLVVALIPAVMAGALGHFAVVWWLGPWPGFAVGSFLVAAVLAVEGAVAMVLLGMVWDRVDLSVDRPGG